VSDRALLLCAYVTSTAFIFLLSGHHRGMQSLGFVMAAGTACIYLATICVLRPILLWLLKKRAERAGK
jgi:predicted RND superfamily exporter protein